MTPATDMIAPITSLGMTFSLKTIIEMGMIKTGDSEFKDETMPVLVYWRATKDSVTPMKGPMTAPVAMFLNALFSVNA